MKPERRVVQRLEGSSIPPRPPLTSAELAQFAAWPQRLRNNIGNRQVQTDDLSAQMQVIPIIEALIAEVRRLKAILEDLRPRDPQHRELCWYHDACRLPIGHVGDHDSDPDRGLVIQRAEIERLRQGLVFIDQNEGVGGNGEGWRASDNLRVTKALLGKKSGRFPLTDEDWQRLKLILGWEKAGREIRTPDA